MPTLVEDQRVSPPPPAIPADPSSDGDYGDSGSSFPLTKGQIGTWVLLTAVIMLVLPILLLFTFERSEHAIREWMGAGMDLDIEVLQLVTSEHFTVTRFGQYLRELRARFPGVIVADMYCLLRLELELSVRARAMIMARDAGLELRGDDDLESSLAERDYLHRSIGRAGLLALRPLQVTTPRDRWHRALLMQARRTRK